MAVPADSLHRLTLLLKGAEEGVIEALWEQAASDFLTDCNLTAVPEAANVIVEQMTSFRYSQIGADGLGSQSFSGMSESYLTDYPERVRRGMQRFRRIALR